MQKIYEQNLPSDETKAAEEVVYTWQKDELAYYFCSIYRDVFKVKFTGERWFLSNRWGNDSKIYQYEYLDGSSGAKSGISHGEESNFYTTKEEAIKHGVNYLNRVFSDASKCYGDDMNRLLQFSFKADLKLQPDLSKLPY